MILIVLGTWNMPFPRPLAEIESLIDLGLIKDEIIVQSGFTKFKSKYLNLTPFFEQTILEDLYKKAEFIVCQAGIGSIMMGLKNNKKIISIARKRIYNEHIDNHQEDILTSFSKQKLVLKWDDKNNLMSQINLLPGFTPRKYQFSEEQISKEIINFINSKLKS